MPFHLLQTKLLFFKNKYNLLLLFLLTLFVFRPAYEQLTYFNVWKVLLTLTIFSAIFNCKHKKIIRHIELGLAIPIIFLSWGDLLWPYPWLFVINTALSCLFTFLCAISIISDMLLKKQHLSEVLKGVICAYFLVALSFAYAFWIIEYSHPGSFFYSLGELNPIHYAAYISRMLYFSFVTVLAIGYGDIVPTSNIAQTAAILEGVTGQFYVAILVSKLIASHANKEAKKLEER